LDVGWLENDQRLYNRALGFDGDSLNECNMLLVSYCVITIIMNKWLSINGSDEYVFLPRLPCTSRVASRQVAKMDFESYGVACILCYTSLQTSTRRIHEHIKFSVRLSTCCRLVRHMSFSRLLNWFVLRTAQLEVCSSSRIRRLCRLRVAGRSRSTRTEAPKKKPNKCQCQCNKRPPLTDAVLILVRREVLKGILP